MRLSRKFAAGGGLTKIRPADGLNSAKDSFQKHFYSGLFCKKFFPVPQILDDLFLNISPKNMRFSTRNFLPLSIFRYSPKKFPFQAEFLTFFSHLPLNNLSLANFSNFYTDFIHSLCFSRKGAGTPWLIYHTSRPTILTYK